MASEKSTDSVAYNALQDFTQNACEADWSVIAELRPTTALMNRDNVGNAPVLRDLTRHERRVEYLTERGCQDGC